MRWDVRRAELVLTQVVLVMVFPGAVISMRGVLVALGLALGALVSKPVRDGSSGPSTGSSTLRVSFSGRGRVLDADGAAVSNARVVVSDAAGATFSEQVWSGEDGRFQLTRVPSRFRVSATHSAGDVMTEPLDATELASVSDPLTLVLAPRNRLLGTVTDARGEPIDGAQLSVVSLDPLPALATSAGSAWIVADAVGHFATPPLPQGRYEVTAWSRGFAARQARVAVGEAGAPLLIGLSELPPVRGMVRDAEGSAVPEARVTVCEGNAVIALVSAANGSFELPGAAVGCFAVAHHPNFAASRRVKVSSAELELRLEHGGTIEGSAADVSGHSLRGLALRIASYEPAAGEVEFPPEVFGKSRALIRSFRWSGLAPGRYTLVVFRRAADGDEELDATEYPDVFVKAGAVTRGVHVFLPQSASDDSGNIEPATES